MPYAPGVQDRSGELLGQGILSGAQSLAHGMEEGRQRGEASKRLRKALSALYPERKHEFETFGLGDLQGEVDGLVLKRTAEMQKQQGQLLTEQLKQHQLQNSDMSQRAESRKGFNQLLQQYGPDSDSPSGQISPRMLLQMGAQAGLEPGDLSEALKAYTDAQPRQAVPLGSIIQLPNGGSLIGTGGAPHYEAPTTPAPPLNGAELITTADGRPTGKARYGDKIIDLPADKTKALSDAQANALQFSERMKFNNNIISEVERDQKFDPASFGAALTSVLPNAVRSDKYQQYDAARRNWVSAVLRKESGAAISKNEEEAALQQYFPKFGDNKSVIKQKADLRKLAEDNMHKAVGDIGAGSSTGDAAEKGKRDRSAALEVGAERDGYRYNGKFYPNDRRAWDKIK